MKKRVLYRIGGDEKVPKDTLRVYTAYDLFNEAGWLQEMEKYGFIINPTHNFELLKKTRIEKKYKPALQAYVDEFEKNVGVSPDENDIKFFYNQWLKKELDSFNDLLKNTKSAVNKRQVLKYIDWVNNELTKETIPNDGTPENISKIDSVAAQRTRESILEKFDNMDKQGWKYVFNSVDDFNLFVNLLTKFFTLETFTLPQHEIKVKKGCKTRLARVLGEIHKELSNNDKLSNDTEYFNLIRILSPFKCEVQDKLYKAITR